MMITTATKLAKLMSMDTVFRMPVGWVSKVVDAWFNDEQTAADPRSHVENEMSKFNNGSR